MNEKEKEILLILQEECAEVTQAVSKCFRFGYDSMYMDKTNREMLETEIGDLQCMISILIEHGIVNEGNLRQAEVNKFNKLKIWSNVFTENK